MSDESIDYTGLQVVRDQQYRKEYADWVATLSPEERIELQAKGLDEPLIEVNGVGSPELDENRLEDVSGTMSAMVTLEDAESGSELNLGPNKGISGEERESLQASIRKMVAELFEAENPDRTLEIIAGALKVTGCNLDAIAQRQGITRRWAKALVQRMRTRLDVERPEDMRVLRRIAGRLLSTGNTRLSVDVLALATGVGYRGLSETQIAASHGITRAAVSKRCVLLADELGLPPSRAMRSKESRQIYSRAQVEAHRKHRR